MSLTNKTKITEVNEKNNFLLNYKPLKKKKKGLWDSCTRPSPYYVCTESNNDKTTVKGG